MSARKRLGGVVRTRRAVAGVVLASATVLLLLGATPSLASATWRLSARTAPTQLPQTGEAFLTIQATDVGDAEVSASSVSPSSPVTIKDTLPEGLIATKILQHQREHGVLGEEQFVQSVWACSIAGSREISCTYDQSKAEHPVPPVQPYEDLEIWVTVAVEKLTPPMNNQLSVEGGLEQKVEGGKQVNGGPVPGKSRTQAFAASAGGATPFGVEQEGYALTPENEAGLTEAQAGAHPFQLTTTLNFNQTLLAVPSHTIIGEKAPAAPAPVRNLHFNLPPGMLGNVAAIPQCSEIEAATLTHGGNINACPADSAVGVARVTFLEVENAGYQTWTVPVFNLTPPPGEPAKFGILVAHTPVLLDTHVRTGDNADAQGQGDYGVEVSVHFVSQLAQVLSSEVTLWGVPGDASHDRSRGWLCAASGQFVGNENLCNTPEEHPTTAFLTLPTSCASPLVTTMTGDSWPIREAGEPAPGRSFSLEGESKLAAFENCEGPEGLPFSPSIKLTPTTQEASAPTGLNVDVHVPQATTLDGGARAESDVRSTTVTLPPGLELSPSSANGLEACPEYPTPSQPGVKGIGFQSTGSTEDPFSNSKFTPEPLRFSPGTPRRLRTPGEEPECPSGSKMGTVTVHSPLLKNPLTGSVYLATPAPLGEPGQNPFNSLVALYIVAEEPESEIVVKIAGEVKLDPNTGQISSTFTNTPQVPFEDFEVNFDSGPRASVSTPASCGPHTTTAAFSPWSVKSESGLDSPVPSSSAFEVPSGCSNVQPFAPGFTAGTEVLQAGAFDPPFSVTIGRPDGHQAMKSASVTLPPGLAAMISSITPCPEPQASLGTCGANSLIGHATAVSGFGPDPFTAPTGSVYFTGPYNGAPFGLSIVTPADAGPFHLGNVVVRSTINVDRSTAAVTINSVLPTIVQGIGRPSSGLPLQLKAVHVVVDRPGFQFNPTNCTPMKITGTLGGVGGAAAGVSAPFQVKNCSSLPFHPTFTATTEGRTSKSEGASLKVRVTSGPGQANIGKTDLSLPIALPSRLTTIQKACAAAAFEANPASCPEGSNIGTAIVHTPVLKNPLAGPAYLVSHGNAAFPDVEFVLQGEGITLVLDGKTDIKKGITYSRFETLPDAPVSIFETTLPRGPHSALTSNVPVSAKYSLCGTKLVMPTTITGQNGAVIKQNTNIAVTGCAKPVSKLTRALQACRKKFKSKKARKKRAACERSARKKYGAKKASTSKGAKHHKR